MIAGVTPKSPEGAGFSPRANLVVCAAMTKLGSPSCLVLAVSLLSVGCDEKKPADGTATTATASVAAAPAPAPVPTESAPPPKPERPKKKLADCPAGNEVSIDNPGIEAELRKKLEKPTGAITKADLKKLKSVNISQVKELDQLDPCIFTPMTGLKELFLGTGDYDDLTPIAGATNLESLRASINQVKDLKPLEKMSKLDRLDLGRTQVSDLKPLAALKSLTELQLDDTQIEDLSPLAELTALENLSIKRTKVKDASALKGLKKLKFLYIGGTPLDDDPMSVGPVRANGAKIISD
jgi:internalin A